MVPYKFLEKSFFFLSFCFFSEIGSFAAAARAAAVVLIHSLALDERVTTKERTGLISQERSERKGPSQCFVRITPEEYPTLWSVYQPKFADGEDSWQIPFKKKSASGTFCEPVRSGLCFFTDQVYVFDSLVLTAIAGDAQSNISFHFAKEVYQNDIKGRQAMADAIYATCLAREPQGIRSFSRGSQLLGRQPRDQGRHMNTVWDAHSQNKFERARLGLPIACLVDYAALAVVVEPLLPLK